MPITVTVKINDKEITHVHIARMTNGTDRTPGKEHGYVVLEQTDVPTTDQEWAGGKPFAHTYGEGLMPLISKALGLLENK